MTRAEAIELLYNIQTDAVYNILLIEKEAIDMAINALEQEPILDKKKGEWISTPYFKEDTYYHRQCNNCGKIYDECFHYCPRCGIEMLEYWEEYEWEDEYKAESEVEE